MFWCFGVLVFWCVVLGVGCWVLGVGCGCRGCGVNGGIRLSLEILVGLEILDLARHQ